jgi:glucosyl-dolichyl phosphate glucuronosyltransferase
VAVCTFNRAEFLDKCLRSLHGQTASPADFKVVVVDNASTDNTRDVVLAWSDRNKNVTYIHEPIQGLARARNTALAWTDSEIIAYTDDDATVPVDWVSKIIANFSALPESVFALGGEIDPFFEVERPAWLSDELLRPLSARLGWSDEARFITGNEWICEVNSAYRVRALRKYNGFPVELGRQGDLLLSGENFINEIARADGYSIYFNPDLRVSHFIPKERLTKSWFRRRFFWLGVTASQQPEIAKEKYGVVHERWRAMTIPMSPREWVELFNDDVGDVEFISQCNRISEIGYLLGTVKLISGR